MAHALNMTMKLKQDPASLAALQVFKTDFVTKYQQRLEDVLRKSKLVHFARIVVVDDLYLQVITEYDGDHQEYTEYFRVQLPDLFKAMLSLAEGAPPWDTIDKNSFFVFTQTLQKRSMGDTIIGDMVLDKPAGYLFSAYGAREVKDILPQLTP
jgi:hypothetical protein